MIFSRVLLQIEEETTWFKIWTRVAYSISYDDNSYTKSPHPK